jgi:hypothetical protein
VAVGSCPTGHPRRSGMATRAGRPGCTNCRSGCWARHTDRPPAENGPNLTCRRVTGGLEADGRVGRQIFQQFTQFLCDLERCSANVNGAYLDSGRRRVAWRYAIGRDLRRKVAMPRIKQDHQGAPEFLGVSVHLVHICLRHALVRRGCVQQLPLRIDQANEFAPLVDTDIRYQAKFRLMAPHEQMTAAKLGNPDIPRRANQPSHQRRDVSLEYRVHVE